ncbi:glycoside hydrolase family 15 protein [Bacteroides faecalis]|uniref:Putative glycosyl hydrolase n=1 Tax=Bacteroides faecalis TaxID=2447885 RepID=A0A401LVL6_9BACE|nr:glycoside hydrolase family 15 protein [Bacteroides faecalis]GCB35566.1 putative glycosyl hydrolase [Bacteroides faecalis]
MNRLNYGVIGNCRTAALISLKGDIEWMCFPDFDSPSTFARLLDHEKGGYFGFEVSENYHITQSYIPHTNILSTQFSSEEGEFTVLDYMPCYRSKDNAGHYIPAELYRYIHWLKGKPHFKVNYHPAPNYAQGKVIHNITPQYIETYCSSNNKDRQYLYSSLSLSDISEEKEIILEKDEFMLLSYNEKVIPIDIEREKIEYCRTLVYWLNWTNRSKKYTLYNDVIERSLLVLKLMSYHNGAVLAALTTSLPEAIGEVRNWDYRFCWLRDASMSIETMFQFGHSGAAKRFMKFIQSTFVAKHEYQIMYGIRGERKLTETILEHLSGYKNSKPIRIGNDAYHQKQNDSFGYLMDLIYQYYCLMPGTLDEIEDMWEMVKTILSTVINDWKKPDKGIWEIRGEGQHFVSSKVMCWVALDRGAKIAQMMNKYSYSECWKNEADKIKENVIKYGWKEEIQSFSQTYDNLAMDSSLLLMEPYGFIAANDIRYHKTVESVKNALFHKGLMYRYNSKDDFGMPTSAFTICTFWLIRALFMTDQKEEARCLFDEVLTYSNHLSLFSEDIDFDTKEQLGNFPQAYSHLALVNTAILFAGEEKKLSFIRP